LYELLYFFQSVALDSIIHRNKNGAVIKIMTAPACFLAKEGKNKPLENEGL